MNLQIKQNRLDDYLAATVVVLMSLGTVFVFSAGANLSGQLSFERFYDFATLRKILFFPLAVGLMYCFSILDYRRLRFSGKLYTWPAFYLLAVSVLLLILVLIPSLGTEVNYARRWLRIPLGPVTMSFQPSELAKWSLILFFAGFIDRFSDSMRSFRKGFLPLCLIVALVVSFIITEDFGTSVFICLLTYLMLIIAGCKWYHLLTPLPFALGGFYFAVVNWPGRLRRLVAFFDPESLAGTTAYQARQSLIAISTGRFFGRGLGRGISKYGHLPEDTTDFIFSIIAEELGFVGTTVVIGLFIAFVVLGIMVVLRCRDRFGQLLAAGIVMTIGIQAAINIGVVTVLLPTKGIPLPFISAGGTSMLLCAAAAGVLINIARQTGDQEPLELTQ